MLLSCLQRRCPSCNPQQQQRQRRRRRSAEVKCNSRAHALTARTACSRAVPRPIAKRKALLAGLYSAPPSARHTGPMATSRPSTIAMPAPAGLSATRGATTSDSCGAERGGQLRSTHGAHAPATAGGPGAALGPYLQPAPPACSLGRPGATHGRRQREEGHEEAGGQRVARRRAPHTRHDTGRQCERHSRGGSFLRHGSGCRQGRRPRHSLAHAGGRRRRCLQAAGICAAMLPVCAHLLRRTKQSSKRGGAEQRAVCCPSARRLPRWRDRNASDTASVSRVCLTSADRLPLQVSRLGYLLCCARMQAASTAFLASPRRFRHSPAAVL